MNSVEQKRRELFEASMELPFGASWCEDSKKYTGRDFWLADYAWQAFNAALDAVEINFPQEEHYWPHDYCGAVEDCRDAIEKTGLGLKVK